jgi:hypothetical protein
MYNLVFTHFDAFIGILGVAVGFGLNFIYDRWKDRDARKKLLRALKFELESNLSMLPRKLEVVKQSQQNVKEGIVGMIEGVPFMRATYEGNLSEISSIVSLEDRNILHHIYWRFNLIDQGMSNRRPVSSTAGYLAILEALKDYSKLFLETEKLITAYLAGDRHVLDLPSGNPTNKAGF